MEKRQLGVARHACNCQPAALTGDAVCQGAEMQVHVLVLDFALTAAVEVAQQATALFCRRGHIEEVPAKISLNVIIQAVAVCLQAPKQKGR